MALKINLVMLISGVAIRNKWHIYVYSASISETFIIANVVYILLNFFYWNILIYIAHVVSNIN